MTQCLSDMLLRWPMRISLKREWLKKEGQMRWSQVERAHLSFPSFFWASHVSGRKVSLASQHEICVAVRFLVFECIGTDTLRKRLKSLQIPHISVLIRSPKDTVVKHDRLSKGKYNFFCQEYTVVTCTHKNMFLVVSYSRITSVRYLICSNISAFSNERVNFTIGEPLRLKITFAF